MTRQRRFQDERKGKKSSNSKEQLSGAQLELNRLKKKVKTLSEDISLIPEKEERIKNFFERNAKPIFEKETALKYKFLVHLDESYESGELNEVEKETLITLFSEESHGVIDFVADEEKRENLKGLLYKYGKLAFEMDPEGVDMEAAGEILDLFEHLFGLRPTKAMKEAKSSEEALVAISDYFDAKVAKDAKEAAIAAGEKPKRASRKAKDAEVKRIDKRDLIDRMQMFYTLNSLRKIYLNFIDERFAGKMEDAEAMALKEDCLKDLADARAAKDPADILLMQIEWIEDDLEEAPVGNDEELKDFNEYINSLLDLLENQLDILNESPIAGVESPYDLQLYNSWMNLPIQLNRLFTEQKKNMRGIEEYVRSVTNMSGLKYFLKQYGRRYNETNFFGEDWFTE